MKKYITTEKVKQIIHEKYNGKIALPKDFEYTNVDESTTFICAEHGEFVSSVYRVKHKKSKYGCQKCSPYGPKDWDYKLRKIHQTHGERYDYSLNTHDYSSREKLKIICKEHGVFEQAYGDHIKGNGCPMCAKAEKRITINNFMYNSIKIHGNDYDYRYVFDDYKNSQSKVKILCKKHGMFIQLANDHRKGSGCPVCKTRSVGEKTIRNYLLRCGIDFEPEKTFDGFIKNKRKCRYDFYIPSQNILIEFDGKQHYSKTFNNHDISDILETDKLKNEYAIEINVPLYRISYTDDINNKLDNIFDKKEPSQ